MKRILLIEDDQFLREIYEVKLQLDLKATVITASSGNQAIAILKENQSFTLIISDFSMKNGSGADVLRYLKENALTIPFYLYTSNVEPEIDLDYPFFRGVFHKFNYENLLAKATSDIF